MAQRREEWQEQKKLARLLDKWLDPACKGGPQPIRWPPNAFSGAIPKARGVKPGVPDVEILYHGKSIFIELKIEIWQMQPGAARRAREDFAGRRAVVGVPLGTRGDVGAVQVGREVPLDRL